MSQNPTPIDPLINILSRAVSTDKLKDNAAIEEVKQVWPVLTSTDWDKINTDLIFSVKNEGNVGKPVKIVASIESITDPTPLKITNTLKATVYDITLQDHRGDSIDCLPIPHERFLSEITQTFDRHSFLVFCGTVISVMKPKPKYLFLLYDIQLDVTPEDLICVRPDSSERVAKKFQAMIKGGSLISAIKEIIVDKLGIKGLDSNKELDKCLDFMILQSFSHGKDATKSLKLHSLVIGPPGAGKKLLTLTAKILNPVTEEVTSVSGRISMAGLVGNVTKKKGKNISTPGYMARASSGVVCIQDFHEVRKGSRQQIFTLLSTMMENGEVTDSTSARWVHEAITSIHLDTNRYSQVNPGKKYDPYSDIDIPTNILSRFDFIIDIPSDPEGRRRIAYEIIASTQVLESYGDPKIEPQWQRELRRIVAYARTNFHVTFISDDVRKYIRSKFDLLLSGHGALAKDSILLDKMIVRLVISAHKYVKAIASAHLRTEVFKEDVDYAFEFIGEKLAFLAKLEPFAVPDFQKENRRPTPEERWHEFVPYHRGKVVEAKFVQEEMNKLTGQDFSIKTVRRDLEQHAKKVGHGKWRIE